MKQILKIKNQILNLKLVIWNFIFGNFNFLRGKAGFTLVEALISISVLGVIGLIAMSILSRTFQGGTKSGLIGDVKQNGEIALNIIDRSIRASDNLVCQATDTSGSTIVLFLKDGRYLRYRIEYQPGNKSYNGYIQQDSPILTDPQDAGSLLCDFTLFPENEKYFLTDNNPSSGVSVVTGYFALNQNPGFKPLITIKFDIGPSVNSGSTFDQILGSANVITFQTTAEIR